VGRGRSHSRRSSLLYSALRRSARRRQIRFRRTSRGTPISSAVRRRPSRPGRTRSRRPTRPASSIGAGAPLGLQGHEGWRVRRARTARRAYPVRPAQAVLQARRCLGSNSVGSRSLERNDRTPQGRHGELQVHRRVRRPARRVRDRLRPRSEQLHLYSHDRGGHGWARKLGAEWSSRRSSTLHQRGRRVDHDVQRRRRPR
jgi:hypothetical protein